MGANAAPVQAQLSTEQEKAKERMKRFGLPQTATPEQVLLLSHISPRG